LGTKIEKLGTDHFFSRGNSKAPDADLFKTLFFFESVGTRYRERLEGLGIPGTPHLIINIRAACSSGGP
jgi:hypothetical protein